MPTQFGRSVWEKNRSWSPAEEFLLVECLEGRGPADAYDLSALADFFRRKPRGLRMKIEKLGYDVPPQDNTRQGREPVITEEQDRQIYNDFYKKGLSVATCAAIASEMFKVKISGQVMRLHFEKLGLPRRRAGRVIRRRRR